MIHPGTRLFLGLAAAMLLAGCSASGGDKKQAATLYSRLGGEAAITSVVEEFVRTASVDPKVNFTRQGSGRPWPATAENVARLKKHLVAFVSKATGGPDRYEGRTMKTAHAGMTITDAEFDALAGHLIASLDKHKVGQKEKDELIAIVGSTRGDIVEKK